MFKKQSQTGAAQTTVQPGKWSNKRDVKVDKLSPQEREAFYKELTTEAWTNTWAIIHDEKDWRLDKGTDLNTGTVHSKQYKGIGRVAKLQCYVDMSPGDLFQLIVINAELAPSWDTNVAESKIIQTISEQFDIHYMVTKEMGGGIVARRDFVTARHYKEQDGVMMTIGCPTSHPERPPAKNVVRGEAKLTGMLFCSVEGEPDKTLLKWVFSLHIGGWLPQFSIDMGLASSMMDFRTNLLKKVSSMKDC